MISIFVFDIVYVCFVCVLCWLCVVVYVVIVVVFVFFVLGGYFWVQVIFKDVVIVQVLVMLDFIDEKWCKGWVLYIYQFCYVFDVDGVLYIGYFVISEDNVVFYLGDVLQVMVVYVCVELVWFE